MKKILRLGFLFVFAFVFSVSWAQERSVSGRVTSQEEGTGLPGVNVVIKGTTTGTITDSDGNFKLNVADDAVLQFSFIGYATEEIVVGARSVVNLEMKTDAITINEVLVTAVGIEREKKALGYGVEKVSGKSVQQVSEPDALRALQGKVPGLNITGSSSAAGSATRITIRGNSSLLGNNQPLFVVDGVPYNNGSNNTFNQLTGGGSYGSRIQDLDPNNIASITVLKGAAAAALYGSRAANGVILVTTKSGSASASRKGLEITFNTSYSIEQVANLPDYQNTYGTGTNFNYQQVNGSWGAPFIGTKPYATTDSIPHWYDGVVGFEKFWGTKVPYQAYPNNVKDFFKTGSIFDNSISVTGGNEKSVMTFVASRMKQDGFVPNTEFDRTNISIGGQTQLDNGFHVGGNIQYTNSFQHSFQGGANNAIGNASAFARTLYLGRNWDLQGQPYQNPLNGSNAFFVGTAQADNPLWSINNAGLESETDRFAVNLNLGYDILDWLNVAYKIGINGYTQRQTDWYRPGSRGANGSGQITDFDVSFKEISSNLLVTVNKNISEDISFRGIVGHNVNQRTTDAQSFQGTGYVDFEINDIDNTNAVVPFGGNYSQRRLFGVFGDFNFGYRDYLFLTLTGRNDWSSTLPQQNRSFFYPAASLSFVVTDALGISSDMLNNVKLRASWAEVGNDTSPYQLAPVYNLNFNGITSGQNSATSMPFNGVAGASLSDIARDPNLKPERTQEVEFGTEVKIWNNRIGLDAAFYQRDSKDQIAGIAVPSETGFQSLFTNIGLVRNKGVEIGLSATILKMSNGLSWDFYGTFTHNKNTIEKLVEGTDEIVLRNTFAGSIQSVHIVGQEYGLLKGTVSARDDEGNLLIDPSNGQLIADLNPKIIGNPNPDFIAGFTNSFSWKGITLSAVIDWRQGGDMYSVTNNSLLGRGVTKDTEEGREINKIIPGVYGDPNTGEPLRDDNGDKIVNTTMVETNALWFGNTFAINAQDEWSVWDATVIRLRQVSLSYSFPKSLLDKTPFGSARVSLTGRNLWYNAPNFPKASNFDPEVSQFGNSNAQGFEFTSSPSVKRYGVNLSVTF